ncbi:hypothetical protein Angca_005583, partial [Angiostrongylus cantonensis]
LNDHRKNRRFEVLYALILSNKNTRFLDRTVTCEENWILLDSRQLNGQFSSVVGLRSGSTAPPKPKLYQKKVMVTIWWPTTGLIHHTF